MSRKLLIEWLRGEIEERGWTIRELGRRSGINPGTLSYVLNYERGAGPGFCQKIAATFGEPPEKIFRLAGLLPSVPELQADWEELMFYYNRLTDDERRLIGVQIKALAQERTVREGEETTDANPDPASV